MDYTYEMLIKFHSFEREFGCAYICAFVSITRGEGVAMVRVEYLYPLYGGVLAGVI